MPSDAAWQEPDFSRRADPGALPEWMDEPCTYEEFRACLDDLAQVNLVTFGYRPTKTWMHRLFATLAGNSEPLHVVDVGCGRGDMLHKLADWSRRRKVRVQLTGIDLNPYAARAAAERYNRGWPSDTPVDWITGDAFSYAPAGGFDVVISSLFTHHLPEEQVVAFMAWMERHAKRGWFINDLHRAAGPYQLFGWVARVAGWHPFVQHDGPVSIRRSFSVQDWQRYCVAAGLDLKTITIESFRPGRLCVGRIK
jgi:SAM-dependent methyltransferase